MTSQQINLPKILELYKSGRYECDVWFYENLMQLVNSMEVFDFNSALEKNAGHVRKIHKLIEENSDSLNDDFDQQQAAQKASDIKKEITQLNVQVIKDVMIHLEKQKYISYTHHAAKLVQKYNYHPKYQQILRNIVSSVYDPKIRVEHVLVAVLFMLKNAQKIEQILAIYDKAIQNCLKIMKDYRKNKENVKKAIDSLRNKAEQVQSFGDKSQTTKKKFHQIAEKLQDYCYGIYFMYTTASKLCDLVKVLQGSNHFSLKINSYKPDVAQIMKIWDQNGHLLPENQNSKQQSPILIEKRMEYIPIKQLKEIFLGGKTGINKINRTCKICLRCVEKDENQEGSDINLGNNGIYHKICQASVKQLLGFDANKKQ